MIPCHRHPSRLRCHAPVQILAVRDRPEAMTAVYVADLQTGPGGSSLMRERDNANVICQGVHALVELPITQ